MATKKVTPKAHKQKNQKKGLTKKSVHKKSAIRDNSSKKLVIAIIIALIGITTIFIITKDNNSVDSIVSNNISSASLVLENPNSNVKVGNKVTMNLYSESGDTVVNVAQATIKYPTDQLTLIAIDTGSSAYPIKAYESSKLGSIEITRGVLGGVQNKKLIAKLEFLAKSPGTANLEYDKAKSMLISENDNQNILNTNRLVATPLEVTN